MLTNIMFDKDRFHNQLALNLGYRRIIGDRQISLRVDDEDDDPKVTIYVQGLKERIIFKASERPDLTAISEKTRLMGLESEITSIVEAVNKAYNDCYSGLVIFKDNLNL